MSETSLQCPAPPVLDPERLRDPTFTIRASGPTGPALIHFDPERHCGAVLHLAGEVWAVYGPMTFAEFAASLHARAITCAQGDDLARWIEACSDEFGCSSDARH